MRSAADMEDKTEKHPVSPGRLIPARELLGDMLLEGGRPADALAEYEASQSRDPNRYRCYWGAGTAAVQAGNKDKARQHYTKLVELAGSGDPARKSRRRRSTLRRTKAPLASPPRGHALAANSCAHRSNGAAVHLRTQVSG